MISDDELMRQLLRASALAKRKPPFAPPFAAPQFAAPPREERNRPQKPRGFGHILDVLCRAEGENGMSQQALADRVGIRAQSVSEALTVLEQKGFITRRASPDDRRITLVCITDSGRAHRAELALEREKRARALFSALTDEEKDTLFSLLSKINMDDTIEL